MVKPPVGGAQRKRIAVSAALGLPLGLIGHLTRRLSNSYLLLLVTLGPSLRRELDLLLTCQQMADRCIVHLQDECKLSLFVWPFPKGPVPVGSSLNQYLPSGRGLRLACSLSAPVPLIPFIGFPRFNPVGAKLEEYSSNLDDAVTSAIFLFSSQ